VALGKAMAARNGYTPRQAGDWYVHSGTALDWLYGRHRIMAFLFELEPSTSLYLPDEQIASETGRNRSAALFLLEQAGCPWAAAAKSWSNCGPLYDDFETSRGWTLETNPSALGAWRRGNPQGVWWRGAKQLNKTLSGSYALTTGPAAGSSASARDLDGLSRIVSPVVLVPAGAGPLSFRYYFAHSNASRPADDWFRVSVEDVATSERTLVYEEQGTPTDDDAWWKRVTVPLDAWADKEIRIVVEARDGGRGNIVEAGLDDVRIERGSLATP